jgi:nucleoside-diphosphate-sugar epimerase/pimeloyl-ACP methyl ester carboxylesterase
MRPAGRHALVFGATGFLGRHLILALAAEGVDVTAACRSEASFRGLTSWLARHGCDVPPRLVLLDFGAPGLGLASTEPLGTGVSEIYNCAGAYRFGMTLREARTANVDSVRAIVALAAGVSGLRRLVHVSGYRVGGQDPSTVPWDAATVRRTYRASGAYEASKIEADAVFQAEANRHGVPWAIVNPSTVSGVGSTGESDQFLGLVAGFQELWSGRMAARPGNPRTFVPVVPVDHLARFMARLPADPATAGRCYWVLDDATPALPDLLRIVGEHYRVKVPRARIPVPLVKRLPRTLTKADPETLSFMASDRYPVRDADEFARRHDLRLPDTVPSIRRWADHAAAYRFGLAPHGEMARRFIEPAGVRTFTLGPPGADTLVLPGLPVNADTWTAVAQALGNTSAVDLPGLGMSSGSAADWPAWLDELLVGGGVRHLIGHSIGAAAAVEAVSRNPGKVGQLTLIAPFFLQARASLAARATFLTRLYLRHPSAESLSERLTGDRSHAHALTGSIADLRRPGTAGRVGRLLRRTGDSRWRADLVQQLRGYEGKIHIIVGSEDPLAPSATEMISALGRGARVTIVGRGRHHLQLTHSGALVAAIGSTSSVGTGLPQLLPD